MPRNETGDPCVALFLCESGIGIEVNDRGGKVGVTVVTDRNDKVCDPDDPPLAVIARFPQEVTLALSHADIVRLRDAITGYLDPGG